MKDPDKFNLVVMTAMALIIVFIFVAVIWS